MQPADKPGKTGTEQLTRHYLAVLNAYRKTAGEKMEPQQLDQLIQKIATAKPGGGILITQEESDYIRNRNVVMSMKKVRKNGDGISKPFQALKNLRWAGSAYETRNQAVQLLVMALRESGDDETADMFVATWGKEFGGDSA